VDWLEVWIDSASDGDYVLLVKGLAERIVIVDPQEGGQEVATFGTYEEALDWLNEDEYDRVEGRWTPER
jgi:hypothetical protein